MTTQQELQDRITPEFIKRCCEYAEGFEFNEERGAVYFMDSLYNYNHKIIFPLLLHRAVEGLYNKTGIFMYIHANNIQYKCEKRWFKNYTGTTLTPCECAILHCLLDVFEEVGR